MPKLTLKVAIASLLPLYVVAHFSHHVLTAVTSPLLPLMRTTFALSYEQTGFMLSAYTMAYAVGHLFSGWLMMRLGPRLMITAGIAGVAAFGLGIGLAPSFAVVVAFQFLMGAAGSGYHPASTTLISVSVPPDNRGQALGLHIIGGSSSYFLTPLLAGLIAPAWGWRGAFVTLAIPTIAVGAAIFVLLGRSAPRAEPQRESAGEAKPEPGSASWAVVVPLVALSCLSAGLVGSAIAFLPLLATDSLGVAPETAALVVAVANAPGVFVAPLAGALSDRLGRVRLLVAASLATCLTTVLVARASYGVLFYALVLLVGAFPFVRMPVSESFILGEVPARHRATVLGFYYFASSAVIALVNPFVGRLSDSYGFATSFAALGAALLAITLACAVAFRLARARRPAAGSPAD